MAFILASRVTANIVFLVIIIIIIIICEGFTTRIYANEDDENNAIITCGFCFCNSTRLVTSHSEQPHYLKLNSQTPCLTLTLTTNECQQTRTTTATAMQ